jgi:hypothetical protein
VVFKAHRKASLPILPDSWGRVSSAVALLRSVGSSIIGVLGQENGDDDARNNLAAFPVREGAAVQFACK